VGKATTFVVGGRENKCAIGRSTAQRNAQALGNNLSRRVRGASREGQGDKKIRSRSSYQFSLATRSRIRFGCRRKNLPCLSNLEPEPRSTEHG
jgi:hypothetical protein